MSQTLKAGTRIELHGMPALGGFAAVTPEPARIARWTSSSGPVNRVNGGDGWHIVRFADGARLAVHESRFRVIDNRA